MEVILGECPVCNSITVNPPVELEHCEGCRATMGLQRLNRRSFPAGTRIDLTGAVFAPDGELLYKRHRSESPDGEVARLRKLLSYYDSGAYTAMGVEAQNFRYVVEGIVASFKAGEPAGVFSSWCGGPIPPAETFRAEIEIDAQHISVRPL